VIALNKIANRIDKGFNIEVRVEPLPPATENTKGEVSISPDSVVVKLIVVV
jgi:hypothetical protein